MKYRVINKENGKHRDVTYEEALRIALGSYRDNDMTRDMLTIRNNIDCMASQILVREEADRFGIPAGMFNQVPTGIAYDESGMRVKE